jgi:HAD superfamily hydrolase (TIGR01459 family)
MAPMTSTLTLPIVTGLSQIAGRYDAAICDVWGVLHNGREPFRPAAEAMRRFRAERGPVVLLSNAPRLRDGVETQFDRIGVPRDFYDAIVTSGGAARDDLVRRTADGRTLALFYLGPQRDNPLFEGLRVRLADPNDADVVLCTGPFHDDTETPEDYRSMLEGFKSHGLPFLCANPDIVVQRGDKLVYCAGALARLYESMGGEVVYYGKPYAPVFKAALAEARARGSAARPLVIGDGLETDIMGANRMGWDALFIAGGVHAGELHDGVNALFEQRNLTASAVMRALQW